MAAAVPVRVCNQEIVRFDLEIKAAVQDIRDCPGPLGALTELNAAVKEKFRLLRGRIQELEQMAKEQDKESEKQALLREVENHKKQMLRAVELFSALLLFCVFPERISTAEVGKLLQEHSLRLSCPGVSLTQKDLTGAICIAKYHVLYHVFLKHNQLVYIFYFLLISANSSRTILEANEEFKSMSGTIQLGRKLITKYNRRELTDKLLIFLALALFLATVLYILKKRLFPFL
ncbi:SEC20 protein, partial [Columbina picui]|nr:SEC20 protein [Columbina picui]